MTSTQQSKCEDLAASSGDEAHYNRRIFVLKTRTLNLQQYFNKYLNENTLGG